MTAAQELFDLVKDMKPGPDYAKPQPREAKPAKHDGRLFEHMPDWPFANLRELGGSASVVTTRGFATEYCATCAKPREQKRVHGWSEAEPCGFSWIEVMPCKCGGAK